MTDEQLADFKKFLAREKEYQLKVEAGSSHEDTAIRANVRVRVYDYVAEYLEALLTHPGPKGKDG